MNYKNTTILISTLALTLFMGAFVVSPTVAYAENLVVDFNPNPLFEQNNFLPEDTVVGITTVTNNSGGTQTILTESINGFDDDGLGEHLNLTIVGSDNTSYFSDTLGSFLATGEVGLGTLGNGASETYTFTVSFVNIDDNAYQGKSLGFDVCVGFEGGETHCGDTVVGGEGGTDGGGPTGGGGGSGGTGGGGGGPVDPIIPLEVFNEEVTETNTEGITAVIEWDSNFLATSQVIYGKESEGPYSLNLTVNPYFGYPLGTVEDPTKVTHHSVLLTGLDIGETYVYRVVSRASPPTVGFQYKFALDEGGNVVYPSTPEIPSTPSAPSTPSIPPSGNTSDGTTEGSGDTGTTTEVSTTDSTQAAALGLLSLPDSLSDILKCLALFLMFVVLIYIIWAIYRNRNKNNYTDNELAKRRNLFFFVGSLVSIFIAYALGWNCTIIPLAILAVVSLLLYLYNIFTNRGS